MCERSVNVAAVHEAKNAFLARMSHEFRTPLNGVIGMLDLLGRTGLDERQRRYQQIAKSAADTLLELTNDVCNQLAALRGGRIEVESELGQGSIFSLTIPLAAAHAAPGGESTTVNTDHIEGHIRPALENSPEPLQETTRSTSAGSILIAEDNEINQLVVGEILRSEGFQCAIVSNGRSAVEAVRAQSYDIVLMDCEMPKMDGFAATREVRTLEESGRVVTPTDRHLPIIALTAHADQGYRQKCLLAGMDDYVSKPIDSETLLATIRRWLHCTHRSGGKKCDAARGNDDIERAPATTAAQPGQGIFLAGIEAASTDSNQPPLNIKTLRDRCLGNTDLMQHVLHLFTQRAHEDLLRIHEALEDNDATTTTKLAHALKGAVANVSANAAAQVVADVESLASHGRLAQARERFLDLEEELTRCVGFVEQMLQSACGDSPP